MTYDFNQVIDRHGTNCIKYDFSLERNKPADALPLWVADMDFQTAPEVTEALQNAVSHGIFGYTDKKNDYIDAVRNWFLQSFGWETKREWLITTPGVVYALNLCVRAFTNPGDNILIQRPVYYPFSEVIENNGRNIVNNPLLYVDEKYQINFVQMEAQIVQYHIKLYILCSPHNPVGRVWTAEELQRLGDICNRHNVIIISDEIHSDFVYPGHKHTVLASISKELSNRTITCTAPSKTFNLAGLQVSNIFIENETLRKQFQKELDLSAYSEMNCLGLIACQAAYTYGRHWVDELLVYLKGNIDYVRDFLSVNLPKIKLLDIEGTYLIWLDFSAYPMTAKELDDVVTNQAKLWLDGGSMFGEEGAHFQRMNIACPRSTLEKAMQQLKSAFKD